MRPTLFITRDDAEHLLAILAIAVTLAVLVAGAMAARRALLDLPSDFFSRALRPTSRSLLHAVFRALLGATLVVAGLLLLVLPGPGVLLITVGFLLWRTRPLYWLLRRPTILRAVNAFRGRHGRPALVPTATPS